MTLSLPHFIFASILCSHLARAVAPGGPWDSFNFAPDSKTLWPAAIHETHGSVKDGQELISNSGKATLSGEGSWIALDYGKEVYPVAIAFIHQT